MTVKEIQMEDYFDNDDTVTVGFTYNDTFTGSSHQMLRTHDIDCLQWTQALDDFLGFLSGVYGYDIKQHVKVTHPGPRI